VVELIQQQASHWGSSPLEQVRGALDLPDSELPQDAEFDAIVENAEALLDAGGNSGRLLRKTARQAGVVAISESPIDDDGGNYGTWRKFLTDLFGEFVVFFGGDTANARTVDASDMVRQAMIDRIPEKKDWTPAETARGLLLKEIKNAFDSFKKQHPGKDPTQEPVLVRSLATLVSAARILARSFPDLLKGKVLSKASGQNVTGVAIAVRSGFLDPAEKKVDPDRLKRACLLWNRVLGLGPESGVVIPSSLDGVRLYFVYEDRLPAKDVRDEKGALEAVQVGEAAIAPEDYFIVMKTPEGQLVLTDGAGRVLGWEESEKAYVARDEKGQAVNRLEVFPVRVRREMEGRLNAVPELSIIRGEDHASEVDTLYDGTRVLFWGAEFKADEPPHASGVAQEIQQAILEGRTKMRTIAIGPGSEGTSLAPYFWRWEKVQFLAELAKRRAAGEKAQRVVFVVNPSETNDSYGLTPTGVIANAEKVMREVLNDNSIRFQDLVPEIAVFDHAHPWVLTRNPAVAREVYPQEADPQGNPTAEAMEKVDYLHILGPTDAERRQGKLHGLIKRNRQPMPLTPQILQSLHDRFGKENVHVGPFAEVREAVESSRGKISREAQVQALTHRLGAVLFPERRSVLLPLAIREETRLYQQKHQGKAPLLKDLAQFLNAMGYRTSVSEVGSIWASQQAGLEELQAVTDPKEHAAVEAAFNAFEAGFAAGPDTLVESMVLGRINATYYLTGPTGKKFLVQRINPIFDAEAIDHNLQLLEKSQAMARAQGALPSHWRDVQYLRLKGAADHLMRYDGQKNAWRVMEFIQGTRVFDSFGEVPAENRRQVARSIGETIAVFRRMLEFVPPSQWKEPLPRFHDHRYHLDYLERILRGEEIPLSLSRAAAPPRVKLQPGVLEGPYKERIATLRKEIEERKELIAALDGLSPVLAHNDLKINNFLYPQDSSEGLNCVALVDLDTVQPGAELDDLGDAIRSAANPAGEEPASISEVRIDQEVVEGIIEGYLARIAQYYGQEKAKQLRPLAYVTAKVYYLELGMRFFADFLVGNQYFRGIKDEASNLYRAEVQMAALKALEAVEAAARTTGLEETDLAGLRREQFLLPEAVSQRAGVGVIAVGLEEPEVLGLGVALSGVRTPNGLTVPVVFVVENADQKAGLEELGVGTSQIFLVGAPETPTLEAALDAARLGRREIFEAKVVKLIDRVDQTLQQILEHLGVRLEPGALALWNRFFNRVTEAFATAASA
jgi:aminoglycoside phosphotransferase (APT) family kinase protein